MYDSYDPVWTPVNVGGILAAVTGYCIFGGDKKIIKITTVLVPLMGIQYILVSLAVIIFNYRNIPSMFALIFEYEKQKAEGKDPVFKAEDIGLNPDEVDVWK